MLIFSVNLQKFVHCMHVNWVYFLSVKPYCGNPHRILIAFQAIASLSPGCVRNRTSVTGFARNRDCLSQHILRALREVTVVIHVNVTGEMFYNVLKNRNRGHRILGKLSRSLQNFGLFTHTVLAINSLSVESTTWSTKSQAISVLTARRARGTPL